MLQRIVREATFLSTAPDPKCYRFSVKIWITFIVAQAAAIETFIVLMFYRKRAMLAWYALLAFAHAGLAALPQLPQQLKTSPTVANLSVALPSVATAVFPLYWSFLSERQGRRIIYLISLAIFVVFSVLAATAGSINALLAMRTLSGAAGCAVTSTGAAVIADIWPVEQRGRAMSAYYVGVLMGPTVGPVCGGLVVQRWGWQGVQWFLVVWALCSLLFILSCLPETLKKNEPESLTGQVSKGKEEQVRGDTKRRAQDKRGRKHLPIKCVSKESREHPESESLRQPTKVSRFASSCFLAVIDPLRVLLLFRSPIVILTIYLASITFLVFRLFEISMQAAFSAAPYLFDPIILGLSFLPNAAGLIAGNILAGKWSDRLIHRANSAATPEDDQYSGNAETQSPATRRHAPEQRMGSNAWVPLILLPCSLVWYGWTVEFGLHWSAPVSTLLLFFLPSLSSSSSSYVAINPGKQLQQGS